MTSAKLLSVQVGHVKQYLLQDENNPGVTQMLRTAFLKEATTEPVWVGELNLKGDEQADPQHGGPDRAVLAYAHRHYAAWQAELQLDDIPYGGWGENLTIDGLDEETVCIGDVYAIGEAVLQVTQPRWPCVRIEIRWGIPGLLDRVMQTGRVGWLHRVMTPGYIQAGDAMTRIDRPYPDWSIARTMRYIQREEDSDAGIIALAECEPLANVWRALFKRRMRERGLKLRKDNDV
ncbi:MAG: MOSC domain-containing protein [Chloroflexi bacterium]|nr:MAG: MOSC domain-containing protein [Chloroflexota bacterium]